MSQISVSLSWPLIASRAIGECSDQRHPANRSRRRQTWEMPRRGRSDGSLPPFRCGTSFRQPLSIRCRRDGGPSFETVLFAKTRHLLSNPARAMHPNDLSHAFPRSATAQPAGPFLSSWHLSSTDNADVDICDLVNTSPTVQIGD